jgi:hypothetical protein
MKKLVYILFVFIIGLSSNMSAQVAVTFNVNMTGQNVSSNGVHLVGSFEDVNYDGIAENPAYVNWTPSAIPLVNQGNGIWRVTLNLVPELYQFKFINGNDWPFTEDVPTACQVSTEIGVNDNRYWTISGQNATETLNVCYASCAACGQNTVRLSVDMTQEDSGINPVGVFPAGIFVAGTFNGWNPAESQLIDLDGNGTYEGYFSIGTASSIQYKFVNGNTLAFAESVPSSCAVAGNRSLSVTEANTIADVTCFNKCVVCNAPISVLFRVDMTLQAVNANGPHVAGSFQGWDPADPNTLMTDPDGDNIYEVTVLITPGTYSYKFINGSSWEDGAETIPAGCYASNNREFTVDNDPIVEEYCYSKCTLDCILPGCNDPSACNFNINDENTITCQYPGCTNSLACNFNPSAGCDNGSCTFPGCTNPIACNFNSSAGCEDGSCILPGCTDNIACNFNPLAGCNDGSCTYPGCTNSLACNFNPSAGCEDESCHFTNTTCNDNNPNTFNDVYTADCNCLGSLFSYGNLDNNTYALCIGENTQIAMIDEPFGLPSYTLQWYYKAGYVTAPVGGSTADWIAVPGATTSVVDINSFIGSQTYACFVTTTGSLELTSQWANGVSYVNYSAITAQVIIGNPNITPFNNYTYAVTPVAGNTYNWTVTNGAVISGQGTSVVSILWGQNGPYQITLTESDGTCSGTSVLFAVNNNCSISVSAASATSNTLCAGTTLQLQAATSAVGITYQWYLNGATIPNETNQNIAASVGGNYQVSITQNGCSAISQILAITELPGITIPILIVDQSNAGCSGSDATVSIADANYTSITWSNGALDTSSISVGESGSYSVTVTDNNGCTATSSIVELNLSLVSVVPICLVTVDQTTGKNNVVWEPVTSDLINSYVVLKETNVADVYTQIGTVTYGSEGIFEDVNSNPQVQANRYKLALIDTCGILSTNSEYHKTIHLSTNQGLGNNVNLIWSGYEGFDFGSYNIYRGSSAATMTMLTTIASNLNSYTDINPPLGDVYYMIEVEGVSCDPQRTLVYSHSNVITTTTDGVDEFSNTISLYPNPANTSINLQVNSELLGKDFLMYDPVGKLILKDRITSTLQTINTSELAGGNYILRIGGTVKRFVVEK